jgi:hypothetical protein
MTRDDGLSQWIATVSSYLPHLSKPQATVLALWSFGMVMSKSCGMTTVSAFLASLLGTNEGSLRQRLREWCWDAKDKRGEKRRAVDVATCFTPLVRWVLSWWPHEEKRLALALDASTLGQSFTVLAVSIVYRGCAIPVGWVIVQATQKGAWKPHWLALLSQLQGSVPADWTVIVLADRGLYARWLYDQIMTLSWHPFLRINSGGKVRPAGESAFDWLTSLVPCAGRRWCGPVTCFKHDALACTLLACWEAGQAEAWLIVTDLTPEQANVCWYAMRAWIECGFKDTKRGGWQWQQTRMTDPARATRLWLAMAVATLWVVSVGGAADANLPASTLDELPETHVARRRTTRRSRPRFLSCFRRGWLIILASALNRLALPLGRFVPEHWPSFAPLGGSG